MQEVVYAVERNLVTPITIVQEGDAHRVFRMEPPGGSPVTFSSARQLLKVLTKHPNARNWTFARYFKMGRFASAWTKKHGSSLIGEPALTTLELFGSQMGACSEVVTLNPSAPSPDICLIPGLAVRSTACGIDLEHRSVEVAKLLFAGFGNKIRSAGYDSNEVLQEVYKGILIRNRGTCPWDPSRSSFGHYVHMICSCVMSNYHRKRKRIGSREHTGIGGYENGHRTEVDVASNNARIPTSSTGTGLDALDELTVFDLETLLSKQRKTADAVLACRILPYAREGYGRKEIADRLNVPRASVSRALSIIRMNLRRLADLPAG